MKMKSLKIVFTTFLFAFSAQVAMQASLGAGGPGRLGGAGAPIIPGPNTVIALKDLLAAARANNLAEVRRILLEDPLLITRIQLLANLRLDPAMRRFYLLFLASLYDVGYPPISTTGETQQTY